MSKEVFNCQLCCRVSDRGLQKAGLYSLYCQLAGSTLLWGIAAITGDETWPLTSLHHGSVHAHYSAIYFQQSGLHAPVTAIWLTAKHRPNFTYQYYQLQYPASCRRHTPSQQFYETEMSRLTGTRIECYSNMFLYQMIVNIIRQNSYMIPQLCWPIMIKPNEFRLRMPLTFQNRFFNSQVQAFFLSRGGQTRLKFRSCYNSATGIPEYLIIHRVIPGELMYPIVKLPQAAEATKWWICNCTVLVTPLYLPRRRSVRV